MVYVLFRNIFVFAYKTYYVLQFQMPPKRSAAAKAKAKADADKRRRLERAATETEEEAAARRAADAARHRASYASQGEAAAAARREDNGRHMREARQVQSPEEAAVCRAQNTERRALARAQATPEDAEAARAQNTERRALARAQATPEEAEGARAHNAERRALARAQATPEEAEAARAHNAERRALARAQATPEEAEAARAHNAERRALARAQATPEEAEAARAHDAERRALARAQATPEEAEAARAHNAERRALARAQATPEEAEVARAYNSERRALARLEATPDEVVARRAEDADRQARAREQGGPEAADERRAADAERHANARLLQTPEEADARRTQHAAHMADVREVQTPQRVQQGRIQRQMRELRARPRALNLDVPEEDAPAACAARAPAGAAGQVTLEQLFDATMAALQMNVCQRCNRAVMTADGSLAPSCTKRAREDPTRRECEFRFTAANRMDPGIVPPELQGLTHIEQQLIARVHPVLSVYKVRGGQYGYSGNIINFPQDVQQLATALPHRLADLNSVITVRTQGVEGAEGHVDFKVRAGRVRAALVWLKDHHRYYHDIDISEENLSQLPANGDVYLQIRGVDERPRPPPPPPPAAAAAAPGPGRAADRAGAQVQPPEHARAGGPEQGPQQEDPEAVGIHVTGMPMLRPEHNEDQVESHVTDWPTIGPQPVNEFTTDGYLTMSFPCLFPTGEGDLRSGRNRKIHTADYFKFLMEYSDRRFSRHPTFRFFAFNSMMRWNALTNGRVFIKNNPQYRNMTAAQLKQRIEAGERNILKQALYHGNKLKGTRQFWQSRCGELLDMVNQLGVPTLFMTLSAADLHWEDLFRLLSPGEDIETMSEARRKDLPPADINPCRKKFSQVTDPVRDLGELLNRVQHHRCSNHYCIRVDKTTGQPEWWPPRLWRANMDATPVLSMGFMLRYIAKYTAKGEKRSATFRELVAAILEDAGEEDSARSVIQKLLIKTVSERDYSAQEVCHILTGQPLHLSSRSFNVVNLRKDEWIELRPDGEGDGENQVGDEQDAAEGDEADEAAAGAGDVSTFPAFVKQYQMRRLVAMNNMTLFQVAKEYSWRNRKWSRNMKGGQPRDAVVRAFPRLKLTGNEERDEAYYRIQVLLHTAWRTEEGAKAGFNSWKAAFEARVPRELVPMEAMEAAVAEAAAELADEEAQFEQPEQPEAEADAMEEWMVVARMGPNGQAERVVLGRRDMDLAYDWHQSDGVYGDINILRHFIRTQKALHVQPDEEIVVDDVAYTPEQQGLINLVQDQINALHGGAAPGGRDQVPKRIQIQGKAGCGKTTVIKKVVQMIRTQLGPKAAKLMAPTGTAANVLGMQCSTIHSACKLRPRELYKPLEGDRLRKLQEEWQDVSFVFIDECSMIGCKLFGLLEKRLREAKPHCDEVFGGVHVFLIGDVRQLPCVGDSPLYSTKQLQGEAAHGKMVYRTFTKSFILSVSQRQADPTFRDALDRLSVGTTTAADYARFGERFKLNVPAAEREEFKGATRLYTTCSEVAAHNIAKLQELNSPVARLPARHNNATATRGSTDDAAGLEPVVYLAKGARIMLRSNMWLEVGLVNGATGTVEDIVYEPGRAQPEDLPAVVMVRFDKYSGPTVADGLVPVPTEVHTWEHDKVACSREQVPLCLAWAFTVHKSQGLTLDRAVISVGLRDFAVGLMYVAMSRVKAWAGLVIDPEFDLNRVLDIKNSPGFRARETGYRDIIRRSR
ncbi:ATP-dependent DNA helicase [Frankliniella fusca]|uniref:ATP-dependent DNA helicase n=1 Tax=Frankliniella fusca TaxID=407009 RepID=A0AAE1LLC5_9NEOP|nr:ATP-dependent DNA helicase [Frankliniella fusca]